jgi:hypothetical protein
MSFRLAGSYSVFPYIALVLCFLIPNRRVLEVNIHTADQNIFFVFISHRFITMFTMVLHHLLFLATQIESAALHRFMNIILP